MELLGPHPTGEAATLVLPAVGTAGHAAPFLPFAGCKAMQISLQSLHTDPLANPPAAAFSAVYPAEASPTHTASPFPLAARRLSFTTCPVPAAAVTRMHPAHAPAPIANIRGLNLVNTYVRPTVTCKHVQRERGRATDAISLFHQIVLPEFWS